MEKKIVARIHAIYREKWMIALIERCSKRGESFLLAHGSLLTREMMDEVILEKRRPWWRRF
jgi:hypothetical protein